MLFHIPHTSLQAPNNRPSSPAFHADRSAHPDGPGPRPPHQSRCPQGEPTAEWLATVPGIGPYRSLLLATELSPIRRCARAEHLVSYAGLAPITRSSGGHTQDGGIPRAANRWVRGALFSAIPSHVRCAPASSMSAAYTQLKTRLGWRTARVAAARKLARIVYLMLLRSVPWRG